SSAPWMALPRARPQALRSAVRPVRSSRDRAGDDLPAAISLQPHAHERQRDARLRTLIRSSTRDDGRIVVLDNLHVAHLDAGELGTLSGAVSLDHFRFGQHGPAIL